ncbi:MAG: hypothetical protein U0822_04925 [Anaerolineae bacterium]
MPDDTEAKSSYVKLSITLRKDVAEKLERIMEVTGLNPSSAIALAIKLLNLKKLQDDEDTKKGQ